jgi:uncharacterized protein YegJ (DUF2314 family)
VKYTIIFAAALALTSCDQQVSIHQSESGRTVTSRPDNPDIVSYGASDEAMNAAIAEAQAHLDYFWERVAAPASSERDFTLKVAFPTPTKGENAREHIWVSDFEKTASGYVGRLANEPLDIVGKKFGDRTEFATNMITDWGFMRDGKMIGFYTLRVMVDDMPAKDAAEFREALGENPK